MTLNETKNIHTIEQKFQLKMNRMVDSKYLRFDLKPDKCPLNSVQPNNCINNISI